MDKIGIIYKIKTATVMEILAHLKDCNNNFTPPLSERINLDEYSRKLHEKSVTFEAWEERCLAGLLAAYFNDSTGYSVFITNVSVLKDFMGSGIASELLRRCIGYAIKEKYREIKLEVNKENNHAIGLYRKFDFIIDDVGSDFLKMKMELLGTR